MYACSEHGVVWVRVPAATMPWTQHAGHGFRQPYNSKNWFFYGNPKLDGKTVQVLAATLPIFLRCSDDVETRLAWSWNALRCRYCLYGPFAHRPSPSMAAQFAAANYLNQLPTDFSGAIWFNQPLVMRRGFELAFDFVIYDTVHCGISFILQGASRGCHRPHGS